MAHCVYLDIVWLIQFLHCLYISLPIDTCFTKTYDHFPRLAPAQSVRMFFAMHVRFRLSTKINKSLVFVWVQSRFMCFIPNLICDRYLPIQRLSNRAIVQQQDPGFTYLKYVGYISRYVQASFPPKKSSRPGKIPETRLTSHG